MAKMQAVQVTRAGGSLELVEREMPEPGRGEVRIRIQACGVCHSDRRHQVAPPSRTAGRAGSPTTPGARRDARRRRACGGGDSG